MKHRSSISLAVFLLVIISVACSVCYAERIVIPRVIEGAEQIIQYRTRELFTIRQDSPDPRASWIPMGREYGEWSAWSTEATEASDLVQVETREGSEGQTEYRFRTATGRYVFGRWGDWSNWTDETAEATEIRQVETRTVSVINIPEPSVNVQSTEQISMLAGTGAQLSMPSDIGAVRWISTAPDVASIDETGFVTAHTAGNSEVRAYKDNGLIAGLLNLHVIDKAENIPADMKAIDEEAFAGSAFKAVDLRNVHLSRIGNRAFSGCKDLRLVLTSGMTGTFGTDVFKNSPFTTIASTGVDSAYTYAQQNNLSRYVIRSAKVSIPVTGIRLSTNELSMNIGDSAILQASVLPSNANCQLVRWEVDGDAVIVDDFGHVDAFRSGTALISATTLEGGITAECTVTVNGVHVDSVTMDQSTLAMMTGDTARLTATAAPENAVNKAIVWYSSDPNVASVINGVVTANMPGSAVIDAVSYDSQNVKASCQVTVEGRYVWDDPAFTYIDACNITETEATIWASVNVSSNPDTVGFCLGTDPDALEISAEQSTANIGSERISYLEYNTRQWGQELSADTVYYYRFYMTYGDTTHFSSVQTFRTELEGGQQYNVDDSRFLSFYTDNITASSAKLHASIIGRDDIMNFGVEVSYTDGFMHSTIRVTERMPYMIEEGDYLTETQYNYTISNLPTGIHDFEYRFFMECVDGTWYSSENSFNTECSIQINLKTDRVVRLSTGQSAMLQVEVDPESAEITWESQDPGIAEVEHIDYSQNEVIVHMVSDGETLIRVTASNGDESTFQIFQVISDPITVRVLTIGNFFYRKGYWNFKSDMYHQIVSFWTYNDENGCDYFLNLYAMKCNAENIYSAYRKSSVVKGGSVHILIDPQTATEMLTLIKNSFRNADNNDVSIIYVGGHGGFAGATQYVTFLTGETDQYFPVEGYEMVADDIPGTKVFIIDSCHSGAVAEYFLQKEREDVCVLSSCLADVEQGTMEGGRSTYMAYYFLQGIKPVAGHMPADKDEDNRITFSEISSYVKTSVKLATRKHTEAGTIECQTPVYYYPDNNDPLIYIADYLSY